MNLLMLILIFLGIWIAGAILYFAWRLTPTVPKNEGTEESGNSPDSSGPGA